MTVQPLLAFYGDDFTGSSAVMEILAFAGVPTVMFLDVPSPDLLARLGHVRAFGIAGVARSRSPEWMTAELPRYFAALKALKAPILHYKTCSTFDSAPHLGSIGRATEIGLAITDADWAPLVVGAPAIGRYQMFGTLFAAVDGVAYRLDRHPVMARHPATPMAEADLCRHLDGQTTLPKAVIDWRQLLDGSADAALATARARGAKIVALDVFDQATLAATGCILWTNACQTPLFAVGSQGVEYALVAHWRAAGLLPEGIAPPPLRPAAPLLVVSGSCSAITARQIAAAEAAGFLSVALDATAALAQGTWDAAVAGTQAIVHTALSSGRSVIVSIARGPDDPAISALTSALGASSANSGEVHERIGAGLGALVRGARQKSLIHRAIFSGGDTSGHAMLAVGAQALEPLAPLAPGAPLLAIRSADPLFDGMEVALKGGQMGDAALFVRARDGGG